MESKYLTIDELSELVSISRSTLAKMRIAADKRKVGQTTEFIPFIKVGKKKVLYDEKDVEIYLQENKIKE